MENTDRDQEKRMALRMFAEPCFGRTDRYHGGNCQHCCLHGDGLPNTADGKGLEPNYSGWARIYVQAGRAIPRRFAAAFEAEKNSENTSYANALKEDVAYYGLSFEV